MKDSPERKRLEELQKITVSVDFKTQVAYLEDRQKWEKTEDAASEKRLAEMQKLPQLVNYLKYKNSNAFDFFRKWDLVFEDNFESGKLDSQKWMTQSYWASQALGRNFSQTGDLHAFTEGKNVSVEGKSLKIEVRKEKSKGMQWQIPFGFVEQEFDYTSGIVSTSGVEWWKHGILEAKIKYDPAQNLVDAIYLLGEESSPQVSLLEMGVKNRLGLLSKTDNGIHAETESLSGLKKGEFYIFRLEWTAHSLIWKINDREIFALDHNVPAFKMHLNAASIVVAEPVDNLPHRFEIDWVRFYQSAKA
jgi:beta-glucanase (GH16 family)